VTTFFVPTEGPADAAKQESLYAALAGLCGRAILPPNERVFKIEWNHDGDEWTAEVGQPLRGKQTDRRRRKGGTVDVVTRLSNPAVVLGHLPRATDASGAGGASGWVGWRLGRLAAGPAHGRLPLWCSDRARFLQPGRGAAGPPQSSGCRCQATAVKSLSSAG